MKERLTDAQAEDLNRIGDGLVPALDKLNEAIDLINGASVDGHRVVRLRQAKVRLMEVSMSVVRAMRALDQQSFLKAESPKRKLPQQQDSSGGFLDRTVSIPRRLLGGNVSDT